MHYTCDISDNALHYTSLAGLRRATISLLESASDVNVQGGSYGSALQAALLKGHETIVRLLLEKGAEVDGRGESKAVSCRRRGLGIRLLLEKGTEVKMQGDGYGSAFQAASFGGHENLIHVPLAKGEVVKIKGDYGRALQEASLEGHENLVRLLLEKGADVNLQDGECGNTPQAVSLEGHEKIFHLLL